MSTSLPVTGAAARSSVAVATPLMSGGAALLLAAVTLLDPSRSGSLPRTLAVAHGWAPADHVLLALGLAALGAAAVLALTALGDRESRLQLGRRAASDGGFALSAFVLAPWALHVVGGYRLGPTDWARPSVALVAATISMTLLGAALLFSAPSPRAGALVRALCPAHREGGG